MNIHDFEVKNKKGESISLKNYKGKVLLIINSATKCGLTPQYTALEELYEKYQDKGLEILDFPCNQFMKQAPGSIDEINSFCTLNYGTKFHRFGKINVNGKDTEPLYVWLKKQIAEDKGDIESKAFEKKIKLLTLGNKKGDIKWNFSKFLVNKNGNIVERYSPGYIPENIEDDIKKLLD